MSKEATRNQMNDILARERKRLGIDRPPTDEQALFTLAEEIARKVVNTGRQVFVASLPVYNQDSMKDFLQKQFQHEFLKQMTPEQMAFLLGHMMSQETITAVET